MEKWKDIIIEKNGIVYDYTGKYQVSNFGRVRNTRGRIMKPTMLRTGYKLVLLCQNGKHEGFTVHRLVATAFIENNDNLPFVNHKDENKTNNHVDNLEWCTREYNANYGTKIQRSADKFRGQLVGEKNPMYGKTGEKHPRSKKVLCVETGKIFESVKQAEQWCGKTGIGACCRGICETINNYHWKYVEKEGDVECKNYAE